jgi:hypothetical protein
MWEYVLAREAYPLSAAAAAPQGTLAVARGPLQPPLADHAAPPARPCFASDGAREPNGSNATLRALRSEGPQRAAQVGRLHFRAPNGARAALADARARFRAAVSAPSAALSVPPRAQKSLVRESVQPLPAPCAPSGRGPGGAGQVRRLPAEARLRAAWLRRLGLAQGALLQLAAELALQEAWFARGGAAHADTGEPPPLVLALHASRLFRGARGELVAGAAAEAARLRALLDGSRAAPPAHAEAFGALAAACAALQRSHAGAMARGSGYACAAELRAALLALYPGGRAERGVMSAQRRAEAACARALEVLPGGAGAPPVGGVAWVSDVQQDARTPAEALSRGGNAGVLGDAWGGAAGASEGGASVALAALASAGGSAPEVLVHVSCPGRAQPPGGAGANRRAEGAGKEAGAAGEPADEEFADEAFADEEFADAQEEAGREGDEAGGGEARDSRAGAWGVAGRQDAEALAAGVERWLRVLLDVCSRERARLAPQQ